MERIPLSPQKKLWDEIPAEQYCSAVTDGTHGTPCPQKTGYRLVTSKNIVNGRLDLEKTYFISASDYAEINLRSKVDITDILISMIGTVGAVCYIDNQPNFAIKNIGLFKNKDAIHGKWLFYFLKSPDGQERIRKSIRGTTQQYIPLGELRKLSIKYPKSLSEMEKIVSLLSSLDDKIELNTQINHNLEEQAKAIFKSWFVDFEPFQNGKFVDSELGRIPHGWKILPFTELVQIQGGGTPKTSNAEYWNGEIPFFTPKDVGNAVYTLATEKNITQDGLNNCNSPLYPVNTVFVTARGTVGKIALSGRPMAMNQSCYALVGKKNLSSYFVHHLALRAVESLKVKASGAVFDAIVTRDFDSEKLISPPEDVIMDFTNKVKPFYEQILRNELQNENLTAMRDTLLPKLMSGEIDVSEVEV